MEDDYESEFSLLRKPEETLFAASARRNVIYLNTFSHTVSPAFRVGYMVLPRPQGQNVDCTDISKEDIKDFKRVANKYGLDFAIVKDKQSETPMYTVFFKARDDKVLEKVMDHFAMKEIILDGKEEKVKPSILEKLRHFKEVVKNTPRKDKEKRKEQER